MRPTIIRRTVDATVEPVTLDEAKAQLRIVGTSEEDDYVTSLIAAARQHAEDLTGRAFIQQTWVAGYECWPCDGVFELARPNVMTVESMTYRDSADAEQTVDATNYQTELLAFPGEVKLKCSYGRPTLQTDRQYPITITFTSGYGETAEDVPQKVKQAILLLISHYYDIRVPVLTGTIAVQVPLSVESLLGSIRRRKM